MDGHVQLSNTNWTQWTLKKVKKGHELGGGCGIGEGREGVEERVERSMTKHLV